MPHQDEDATKKKKKKKRRYVDILRVPMTKLTGWQEVTMDVNRLDAALEFARTRPREE